MLFWRLSICPDIPSISALRALAVSLIAANLSLYSESSVLRSLYCSLSSLTELFLFCLSFSISSNLSEWSCLLALNVFICSVNTFISPWSFWFSSSRADTVWLFSSIWALISLSWFSAVSYSDFVLSYSDLESSKSSSTIFSLPLSSAVSFLILSVSSKNALTSYFLRSVL